MSDAAALGCEIQEIRAIAHRGTSIVLSATQFWRARQNSEAGQHKVFVNDEARVQATCLVVRISRTAGTLIHIHCADIRLAEERALDASDTVIRFRIWSFGPRTDVHQTNIESTQCAGDFSASIDRDLLPCDRINTDLTTKEEQVAFATHWKGKDSCVL